MGHADTKTTQIHYARSEHGIQLVDDAFAPEDEQPAPQDSHPAQPPTFDATPPT
jgi:hypothetical protein